MDVFKLKELYDMHKDHVAELIFKSKIKYGERYRSILVDYFHEKNLPINLGDIDRMIMSNYISNDEISKRPLAKLYRDIGRQLGLLNS